MKRLVLLVDDDEIALSALSTFFVKAGIEVVSAANGKAALVLLENVSPDLIVTDIRMPIMDGIELIRQLKNNQALDRIPVIAMSGSNDDVMRREVEFLGVGALVDKPVDEKKMVEMAMSKISG